MIDLDVSLINSVYLRIDCERGIAKELSEFFTFRIPGYQYMPAYKSRIWDGTIKLFNIHTQELYAGLIDYVEKFALDRNYSLALPIRSEFEADTKKVRAFVEDFLDVHSRDKKLVLHEHQAEAIHHALEQERCLLLSPTASGKSLIVYSLVRFYLDKIPKNKKILIVVPTVSLVEQMVSDFADYSSTNEWNAGANCHKILGGAEKITAKRVVVSTWQSIFRQNEKYFEQFGAVVGDECLDPYTKISMADGRVKNIKDIVVGDMVKTINEDTKNIEEKAVLEVHKNISLLEQMYEVSLNNNKIIKITGNHKVMLKSGEWKRVDELQVGNIINSIEGTTFDD